MFQKKKPIKDFSIVLIFSLSFFLLFFLYNGQLTLLGFYSKNRIEWCIAEQACYAYSIVPVPLYDTLGAESVEYVVKQTELLTVLCSKLETPKLINQVAPNCSTLKNIIQMEVPPQSPNSFMQICIGK